VWYSQCRPAMLAYCVLDASQKCGVICGPTKLSFHVIYVTVTVLVLLFMLMMRCPPINKTTIETTLRRNLGQMSNVIRALLAAHNIWRRPIEILKGLCRPWYLLYIGLFLLLEYRFDQKLSPNSITVVEILLLVCRENKKFELLLSANGFLGVHIQINTKQRSLFSADQFGSSWESSCHQQEHEYNDTNKSAVTDVWLNIFHCIINKECIFASLSIAITFLYIGEKLWYKE